MVKNGLLIDAEVADRLQVSPRTLRKWRAEGTGPPWIQIGRQVRYNPRDVKTFLEKRRHAALLA